MLVAEAGPKIKTPTIQVAVGVRKTTAEVKAAPSQKWGTRGELLSTSSIEQKGQSHSNQTLGFSTQGRK